MTSNHPRYNSAEHPIPFHKATDFGMKTAKKIPKSEIPDQEDVYDNDDAEGMADEEPDNASEEDEDVSKDKLIKNKAKPKAASKSRASAGASSVTAKKKK
jgi:replication factor C subunit 1